MKDEDNRELEKYRDIILATVDYEIKRNSDILEMDQLNQFIDFHESFKQRILTNYKIHGLVKLKETLEGFSVVFKTQGDLEYGQYIKAKTGHDYDLFGDIQERIPKLLDRKNLRNKQELLDVAAMIALSRKSSTNNWLLPTLKNLRQTWPRTRRKGNTNNRILINHIFEINSPDSQRYVEMYETNNMSTQVSVILENNASAAIYQVRGVGLGLKVSWKDDNNLLIETKKNYVSDFTSKQINIRGIVIKIEYVEN